LDAKRSSLSFDPQDHELVELIEEFVRKGQNPERLRRLFNTHLHPHGIKELAASRERRIAYAVVRLLDSLDTGKAQDRLLALRAVRDELIDGGDQTLLLNTGRALLETMKHLVRERGPHERKLQIAHDFFSVVSGRPRDVRRQLRAYHLLEMSEQWNQVAFDHHVHDANTKGRKSPTHLIVDAWIKGIREMTVIYYSSVPPEALAELVEAAEIMGVSVAPGIEVTARFRGKAVPLIWTPRGLSRPREYVDLLSAPEIRAFFAQGEEVIAFHTRRLLRLLETFNHGQLAKLNADFGVALAPLDPKAFLKHVGVGQPSRLHLSVFLHQRLLEHIEAQLPALREQAKQADPAMRSAIEQRLAKLDALTPDELARVYLSDAANNVRPVAVTPEEEPPALLTLSPLEMVTRLNQLRPGSDITLNPSSLSAADVLEILFECRGAINHLETFNLKDHRRGLEEKMRRIGRLRLVLNGRNPITCKRMLHELIRSVEESDEPGIAKAAQLQALQQILSRMPELLSFYAHAPLQARMGTDSTGRAREWAGMGLALVPTLPKRAQREFTKNPGTRSVVPVRMEAMMRSTWFPRTSGLSLLNGVLSFARTTGLRALGYRRVDDFVVQHGATHIAFPGEVPNLLTLGGIPENAGNGVALAPPAEAVAFSGPSWRRLNSNVKNVAKVLIGFVPAFLSFKLTNSVPALAWFGAFIWFGITGFRNIIQAVVGGGGLIRSELLKWKDLVRWGRVADSLLYTGLSVPLLDYVVKELTLHRGLGITTATHPWLLYGAVGLTNGCYIFSHNTFRGLPRQAAFGNFLRPAFAVPLATGLSALALHGLLASGMDAVAANALLLGWAAVISKLSSDSVAAVIEGIADRNVNVRLREKDYASKLPRLLEVHGRLEALFPNIDVVESLASPKEFFKTLGKEALELEKEQVINALDLMYLWMYQPRARVVFRQVLASRTPDERCIILRTQRLLERKRPISELFIDDLVGKNFSPPLAFYLEQQEAYLRDMRALALRHGVEWEASAQPPAPPLRAVPAETAETDSHRAAG
jgi:hypothetical protein